MVERKRFTGERVIPGAAKSLDEHLMMLRHLAAYDLAGSLLADKRRALDVGCGAGYGTRRIADGGLHMTGLEVDVESVVEATQAYASENCCFLWYDGSTLPFRDSAVDGAVALQVIEHIDEDRRLVGEVARVLKDGAVFVLTTPNALLRLNRGQRPWNRFHVREYDEAALRRLLAGAFGEVRIHGLVGSPTAQELELRRLRRIRTLSKLDPWHFRELVPEALTWRLRAVLRRMLSSRAVSAERPEEGRRVFGEDDFSVVETTAEALDLVAICRK